MKGQQPQNKFSLSDIIGLEEAKDTLELLAKKCIDKECRVGILLWGPPGCGKSFLIEVIASVYDFEIILDTSSNLTSRYVGESEKAVQTMFDRAESIAQTGKPVVIFIDEAESLLPCRESTPDYKSDVVNVFLISMSKSSEYPIMVVLATNHRDKMDTTVLRDGRINNHIFVGFPKIEDYKLLWKMYLDKIAIEDGAKISNDVAIDELADLSYQKLTPVSIKAICEELAMVTQSKSGKQGKIEHDRLVDAISKRAHRIGNELDEFKETLVASARQSDMNGDDDL